MIYRGSGSLAVVYNNALNTSPSPLSRQQVVSLSPLSCVSPGEICDRSRLRERLGGMVEEPNHTTARKPGPLQINQCSLVVTQNISLQKGMTLCL